MYGIVPACELFALRKKYLPWKCFKTHVVAFSDGTDNYPYSAAYEKDIAS